MVKHIVRGSLFYCIVGVFFATCIILSWLILPCYVLFLKITATPRATRITRVRLLLSSLSKLFFFVICSLKLAKINVSSLSLSSSPGIYVANHPTLFDAVLVIAQIPTVCCIGKPSLTGSLAIGPLITYAAYIVNEDTSEFFKQVTSELNSGRSVLIFPEGTRSNGLTPGRFRRGAARAAIESGYPLYPLLIHCDEPVLQRSHRWFEFPKRTCTIRLEHGSPIEINMERSITNGESPGRISRRVTSHLEKLYRAVNA